MLCLACHITLYSVHRDFLLLFNKGIWPHVQKKSLKARSPRPPRRVIGRRKNRVGLPSTPRASTSVRPRWTDEVSSVYSSSDDHFWPWLVFRSGLVQRIELEGEYICDSEIETLLGLLSFPRSFAEERTFHLTISHRSSEQSPASSSRPRLPVLVFPCSFLFAVSFQLIIILPIRGLA